MSLIIVQTHGSLNNILDWDHLNGNPLRLLHDPILVVVIFKEIEKQKTITKLYICAKPHNKQSKTKHLQTTTW